MSVEDNNCNIPILTRSNVGTLGMGWDGDGSATQEENRPCDPIPSDCESFFGEAYGTEWLDNLVKDFN